MPIYSYKNILPKLDKSVFVSPSADLIGDVELGPDSSLWFNVVVRGDVNYIRIGKGTNIQDGSVIHVTRVTHPTVIGDYVTVGHNVNLHGCTVNDLCLIGMGAIVLDGAVVEKNAFVAAGTLVLPNTVVPGGTLFAGSPGKVKRELTMEEIAFFQTSADNYIRLKDEYLSQEFEKHLL
ncbi:MAG: gamma carbonic anhydrase family protein [Candidatus Caenarcaniphilales bacterium]|nr:gamma carbonic anhydrase family protein [Candidatus Caenarcaniphilales bacterium]